MKTYLEKLNEYVDKAANAVNESTRLFNKGEIKLLPYKFRTVLPGHVYSFEYYDNDMAKNVHNGEGLSEYYNFQPLVLAFKSKDDIMMGIDITGLPIILRKQLFNNISKVFERQIKYNINAKEIRYWQPIMIDSKNYHKLVKLKNKSIINNYDRKKIKNLRILDWDSIVPVTTLYTDRKMYFNRKMKSNFRTLLDSQLQLKKM